MRIVSVSAASTVVRMLSVAAIAAAMGCGSLTVNTDWNTTIDFTKYSTWNFKIDTLPYSTFTQQRLRQAIGDEMMKHGLTRDTLNPQLIVVYRINLSSQTQVQTVGYGGYGYGPAWGGYGGYYGGYGGVGVSTTTVSQIPLGALTLAMVDLKLNQLVWRGEANAQLNDNGGNAQLLQDAMKQLFAQFPPKAGTMPSNTQF
jgi:hypothetical protein